ncbi:hypothetical protein QTG54_005926 [Skeletonema marinoi]|uniref:CDAN1-interacting nuclease 1 n=1 Tax=Skeletonema marinoi TaxID=267567 RepID=A0AAD8YD27_9STRA|nr:hypothetical protein QTG54_005926 [Skeletonema marinoi]
MTASSLSLAAVAFIFVSAQTTAAAYLDHIFDSGTKRVKRKITWEPAAYEPVPISKEIELLRKDVLIRRGEFGKLYGSRQLEVELECCELGLTFQQALSIRKQLLIKKARMNHWKLKEKDSLKGVISSFQTQKKSLAEIAVELDLPPVSIFRAIMARRVLERHPDLQAANRRRPAGKVLQSIIFEDDEEYVDTFLSKWELEELQSAKKRDMIGYVTNSTSPQDWENELYSFLDGHGINYAKEEDLKSMGTKSTPDCLLLDDVSINGRKVRWIEFKSYYASGLRENWWFTKKLLAQSKKYEDEFGGEGAIIMKSGFSETLASSSTLFLDSGPLSTDFICIY